MRAVRVSALITVAAIAASMSAQLASPALGLEPGVHIDPGSPAAKEYALPVNQARVTGSGGERSGESPEKLFGAGIKPPSSGSKGGRARYDGQPASRADAQASRSSTPGGEARAQVPPTAVQQATSRSASSGGASALVLFAGGVAILVLGTFTGIVLRHNRRPTSAS
jgi:hypothetical protein